MIKLEIPEHPFHPNDGIVPDPALLDALVAHYEMELEGAIPDAITFFASSVPLNIFGRIFGQDPRELPARNFTWMQYLAGYFGGVWVASLVQKAQLENMTVRQTLPPTKGAFDLIVSNTRAALGVVGHADEAVLEHCEGLLPELVETFGYYKGALLQILEVPPQGVETQTGRLIGGGPLWCGHADPRLEALPDLHEVTAKLLRSYDPHWNRLLDWIPQTEQAGTELGRSVCRESFSVQGWSPHDYEQLISLMAVFVEVFQATALTSVRAVADRDARAGRQGCVANACLISWREAYMLGMTGGGSAREAVPALPSFIAATSERERHGGQRALSA